MTADPIEFTLSSIGAGATAGASVTTLGLVVFRLAAGTPTPSEQDVQFFVLTAALFAGIAAAVLVASRLMPHGIEAWRRGVTGATAAFCAVLLAGLTAPVHMFGGVVGLGVYGVALAAVSRRLHRKAKEATA